MAMMSQHLEEMDVRITDLRAELKADLEEYRCAKAATAEAARALSLSSEDKRLQLQLRQAESQEEREKEIYDKAEEYLRYTVRTREDVEALLKDQYTTLREMVSYPLKLLEKCSSPERSSWETQLILPMTQTHGEVLPWPEFDEGSHEVFDSLDDSRRVYDRPGRGIVLGSNYAQRAETLDEVRMCLYDFMQSVNYAAQEHGISVHCCGGSERCMSQAQMIMRPAGVHSELASMSKHILGVVLVTCSLQLHRGERLEDALHDPLRRQGIMTLLQKAYADAVMDEAPLLVLTDYDVTVFLRRSGDVKDKRLWASEPIWADQHNPPARAAWLNGLQQAEKLRSLKQALLRTHVPHPLEERQTLPCQQQTNMQWQQAPGKSLVPTEQSAALNDSAAQSLKRKRAEVQEAEEPSFPVRAVRHHTIASGMPQPAASGVTVSAAEETLLISELGLTDEHLVGEPYGYTYKGTWAGKPVAVKVYNLRQDGAVAAYEREKVAYQGLKALQGTVIPYFLRSGVLAHTGAPVIVTSYEGAALDLDKPVPEHLQQAMEEALEALHAAGAAHRDVNISKFVVNGDAVRLVDFERLALNATEEQKNGDMWAFYALLP